MVARPPGARDYTAGANIGAKKDFAGPGVLTTEDVRYRSRGVRGSHAESSGWLRRRQRASPGGRQFTITSIGGDGDS